MLFALLVLEHFLLALLDLLLHVDKLESLICIAPQSLEQQALLLLHVQALAHVVTGCRFEQVIGDGGTGDLRPLDCWPCVFHDAIELAHLRLLLLPEMEVLTLSIASGNDCVDLLRLASLDLIEHAPKHLRLHWLMISLLSHLWPFDVALHGALLDREFDKVPPICASVTLNARPLFVFK